jgi:hypothetical protein
MKTATVGEEEAVRPDDRDGGPSPGPKARAGMAEYVKAPARPVVRWVRQGWYAVRFRRALGRLRRDLGRPVTPCRSITTDRSADELWEQLGRQAPPSVARRTVDLAAQPQTLGGGAYWRRYGEHYRRVSQGREKALEHALTFALLDFSRVRRYVDIAAAASPIGHALAAEWPRVEYWKQDLLYRTDPVRRVIGGPAQRMESVAPGSFDALSLHCSFEHFAGPADMEFVGEVDRVLSGVGACLILPLYLAATHRIAFNPTLVAAEQVRRFDAEAELRPTYEYHQEHGRLYSPETLAARLLGRVPPTLRATLIRFTGQDAIDPGIYLNFALVLHRPDSIFRCPE